MTFAFDFMHFLPEVDPLLCVNFLSETLLELFVDLVNLIYL